MEHEVFVPVSAERLRQVLADPERVAGAVPGLQRDAEETAGPLSGRLKVRVGGHTITYRGSARTAARADGTYTVEGEGAEVRGSGSVKLTLTVRVVSAVEGATLVFGGSAAADGRIAEGSPQAVESAVRRLLDRFAEGLGAAAPPDTVPSDDLDDIDDVDDVVDDDDDDDDGINLDDTNVLDEVDGIEDLEDLEDLDNMDDIGDIDVPPAEAAHARRTMIGRSAEEVDHAPPRGRYAPAPAAESLTANATLRWAAPAAALALASAIVVGRALRRRR
ncbi:SRPBCC domain-containing protein [Streptomyces sp. NPDC050732]|uniref:SRPBCC domain-containing protein n=1 Tax=Streptomyces sp. NPDC050732 TaxID=3154632 RepID=UPI0034365D10